MAIPGNNRTGLTTQVTQSDPMMNSYGDPVTSPSTATDCRILRRKLGTGFVPSFAGMALSNNSNRLGSSPIGREPLEVKPYSDGVVDSWFDSSSRGGCSDGGGQMPADPRPVDLQLQQQQPARADAIARTSFCRSNDTMAPSGISIKNVRRMSTLLDDLNNRNANNASRRASTGSLPPAAEIEFCVPQVNILRLTATLVNRRIDCGSWHSRFLMRMAAV